MRPNWGGRNSHPEERDHRPKSFQARNRQEKSCRHSGGGGILLRKKRARKWLTEASTTALQQPCKLPNEREMNKGTGSNFCFIVFDKSVQWPITETGKRVQKVTQCRQRDATAHLHWSHDARNARFNE